MRSRWNDADAACCRDDLELRVYTSRLLGQDPSLILAGGGNTSVKLSHRNVFGDEEELCYVKGSGVDLATIDLGGFAPLRRAPIVRLGELQTLSDEEMVRQFRTHCIAPDAPVASVEAIVHATLPFKFIDHTHADAVVAILDSPNSAQRVRELYGGRLMVLPYVMPGFKLARYVAQKYTQITPNCIGMIWMHHGVVTWGDSARQSYERMIQVVSEAEDFLKTKAAFSLPAAAAVEQSVRLDIARVRADVCRAAGRAMIVSLSDDAAARAFARRDDLADLSQVGTVTPDHVIRTKPWPQIGRDVQAFAAKYRKYFDGHRGNHDLQMVDPAPRVILDRELGMLTIGPTATDAGLAAEVYRHTIDMILHADALGGYSPLGMQDLFDIEYWDLEQAKLRRMPKPLIFTGEVALVTGAASGIGRACVDALMARGAAVVGLDLNPVIASMIPKPAFLGVHCDVTDESLLANAVERAVRRFGGIDMLVLNAGIFPASCRIESLSSESIRKTMAVNLDANLTLMRLCHPMLKLAPSGGRVVVIGSKNVPAPGAGAAAYSTSKAALNQLARVAAIEWGGDAIRVNSIHPNQVFDTALWTKQVIESRAKAAGVSVEQYKSNNILRTNITSSDVAELAAAMCGPAFAKTTGAQVPVDGGNDRVI